MSRRVPGHPSQVRLRLRVHRTRPFTSCRQGRRHLRARSVERVVFFLRVARRCSSTQPTSQRVSDVLSCCCRCRFLTTGARGPAAALAKPIRPLTSTASCCLGYLYLLLPSVARRRVRVPALGDPMGGGVRFPGAAVRGHHPRPHQGCAGCGLGVPRTGCAQVC